MAPFNKDGSPAQACSHSGRQKWIRERDETEVDQGQKKREEAMPWQHVADRNAAVQCHLWRDALFGSMQQQLEMKKPARLSGLFEFGSSYWT